MQKMNFEEAKMTVVTFDSKDIITTSPVTGEGSGSGGSFFGAGDKFTY